MTPTATLFNPPDADEQHALWKANCGPCALAALLGVPVADVRHLFPQFPAKPWANPTALRTALTTLGVRHRVSIANEFPKRGLAFVQWQGPWLQPGVPVAAAYRHTHWIACSGAQVYDVNAGEWIPADEWVTEVVPHLMAATKGSTGWFVRVGIEVPA